MDMQVIKPRRKHSAWRNFKSEILFVLVIALVIFANDLLAQSGIRYIHQERSLYRNILVTEDSQRRCLRFTITSRSGQNQSCRYLDRPVELVFPYAKMTLSSLLVQKQSSAHSYSRTWRRHFIRYLQPAFSRSGNCDFRN